jgi:hypothetical protein
MKDISIIIPIHVFDESVTELLPSAIKSVPAGMKILIICKKEIENELNEFLKENKFNAEVHTSKGDSDFCSMINDAVDIIDEKWFSVLEYDDTYTDIWFDNVEKYVESNEDVSIFLPLTNVFDYKLNKFINFSNDAAWASSFSNEIGYIDNDCLQNFFNFNLTGAVINTDDFADNGGLKPTIKISFWYEFILRLTKKGKKIYTIPKVGYNHYLGRDNSLMDIYSKTTSNEEVEFWFKVAKEECVTDKKKKITYTPTEK